jgi:hypothetical protein
LLLLLLKQQIICIFSLLVFSSLFLKLFFRFWSCLCPRIFHFRLSSHSIKCIFVTKWSLRRRLTKFLQSWWSFLLLWRLRLFDNCNRLFYWNWFFYFFWCRRFFLYRYDFSHFIFFEIVCGRFTIGTRTSSFISHSHLYQFGVSCEFFFESQCVKIIIRRFICFCFNLINVLLNFYLAIYNQRF